MTDFDKKLIEKAEKISRWHYRDLDILMGLADTDECRELLNRLRWDLYDSIQETL